MIRPNPEDRPTLEKVEERLASCHSINRRYSREHIKDNVFPTDVFTYQDNYYGLETVYENVRDGYVYIV